MSFMAIIFDELHGTSLKSTGPNGHVGARVKCSYLLFSQLKGQAAIPSTARDRRREGACTGLRPHEAGDGAEHFFAFAFGLNLQCAQEEPVVPGF
jgi:hypothetical protein